MGVLFRLVNGIPKSTIEKNSDQRLPIAELKCDVTTLKVADVDDDPTWDLWTKCPEKGLTDFIFRCFSFRLVSEAFILTVHGRNSVITANYIETPHK